MKQPVSRNPFKRAHGTVAVYLQEGAPLTDALWNEAIDTGWTNLRGVILDSGLRGTAGSELMVEPVQDAQTGEIHNLTLKGGPGHFYCDGLPIVWPEDLLHDRQRCGCHTAKPLPVIFKEAEGAPVFIWLESRAVWLDETDTPELRDPAVQSERGAFRRAIHSCVHVAAAPHLPGPVVKPLLALEAVTPHLKGTKLQPSPAPTNVRLTVQGAYGSDENVHYHVELVRIAGVLDKYTHLVELLWDDRIASTVTRLASDAEQMALEIEVHSTEGFEPGNYIRLEGEDVDGQIYEVTSVDGYKLGIRRSLCCEVSSLADVVIVAHQINEGVHASALVLTLMIIGGYDLVKGSLVTDLMKSPEAPNLPFGDLVWRVTAVKEGSHKGERIVTMVPHFGLTEALSPWGPPLALMAHARIHEHCVVVEEAACWQPGMRVRISGKPRKSDAEDPCWQADDIDEGHECWPTREPLFKDEDRTVTWVERCGKVVECCETKHTTMTLRLDTPLSADHSKCCDEVRPARDIKVRRYSGHECQAKLQALWPCCADTGGVCCLKPSFTFPSGLEVVLTYRGGTEAHFQSGDAWTFAARAGGWYEQRVFVDPDEAIVGVTPLAMILSAKGNHLGYQFHDIRPIPAAFDQTAILAEIHHSCAELATYFLGTTAQQLAEAAQLALFPRLQANVAVAVIGWQPGLVELLYQIARDFIHTHQGLKDAVEPKLLAASPVLAVAFKALANAAKTTRHRPGLSDRELAAIASALSRAASTAAAILGGCCGDHVHPGLLKWPPLLPLDNSGPRALPSKPALPICPDDKQPKPDPKPEFPIGEPEPDPEPKPGFPIGQPEPGPGPDPMPDTDPKFPIGEPGPGPKPDPKPGFPIGLGDSLQPLDPGPSDEGEVFGALPRSVDPNDVTIGTGERPDRSEIPGAVLLTRGDVSISDLFAGNPDVPDDDHELLTSVLDVFHEPEPEPGPEPVGLMQLATEKLQILETLNPSTAHKIAADWPTLAHVYGAKSEGAVRKRVIASVHRLVAELRELLTLDHAPGLLMDHLRTIWSRHLVDVAAPPPALIARSLPAPLAPAHEEERNE